MTLSAQLAGWNLEMGNSYEDARRAAAYAELEFPGTYYLAYRDLPALIQKYAQGGQALDFGCGAGRSTRFLEKLGFQAVGVDISAEMIENALSLDPQGDYRLIRDGDFSGFQPAAMDLILSAFTFDNIPALEQKISIMRDFAGLLSQDGIFINLVSAPEIYVHEWASFSTQDFPENRQARSGDRVKIIITDIADSRPVEDVVCDDEEYRRIYAQAGLELVETYQPLGKADEPFAWVSETEIAPWTVYVLRVANWPPSG